MDSFTQRSSYISKITQLIFKCDLHKASQQYIHWIKKNRAIICNFHTILLRMIQLHEIVTLRKLVSYQLYLNQNILFPEKNLRESTPYYYTALSLQVKLSTLWMILFMFREVQKYRFTIIRSVINPTENFCE